MDRCRLPFTKEVEEPPLKEDVAVPLRITLKAPVVIVPAVSVRIPGMVTSVVSVRLWPAFRFTVALRKPAPDMAAPEPTDLLLPVYIILYQLAPWRVPVMVPSLRLIVALAAVVLLPRVIRVPAAKVPCFKLRVPVVIVLAAARVTVVGLSMVREPVSPVGKPSPVDCEAVPL